MKTIRARSAAIVIVLTALFLGGCATPLTPPALTSALPESTTQVAAPPGFIGFCTQFPDQCTQQSGQRSSLPLTDQNWAMLNQVNRKVNDAIWPEDDEVHYGRAEYWTIPTDGYGDCDDYAVTKRKELLGSGLSSSALRLAIVYAPWSGRHAVLTVSTDKGDFVLDNLTNDVLPWNKSGFSWIMVQDRNNPILWDAARNTTFRTAANNPASN